MAPVGLKKKKHVGELVKLVNPFKKYVKGWKLKGVNLLTKEQRWRNQNADNHHRDQDTQINEDAKNHFK